MNEAAQEADEKKQRAARKAVQEARDSEQETRKRASDMSRDYDVQLSRMNRKNEKWLSNALQDKDHQMKTELERSEQRHRESRASETTQLRDQAKEASQYKREAKAEYNNARAKAIQDVEAEYSDQNSVLNATHEAEVSKLKASHKETERYLARSFDETVRDQNRKLSNVIRNQNDDHAREMSHSYNEFETARLDLEKQNKRDKQFSELRSEKQAERLNEQRNQAMQKQSDIYQKSMSEQRQSQQAQIQNLERKLNDNNTTADPGQVSAAAEAAIRGQMEVKYGKTFSEEQARNARDRDSLTQNFAKKMEDTQGQNQDQTGKLIRDQNLERHGLQKTFTSHIQDMDDAKKHQLALNDNRMQKTQDNFGRLHERSTSQMRRHYEDLINARETDTKISRSNDHQDHEFEKRMLQREFSAKVNDMSRRHEKERTEERTRYEDQIADLRSKLAQAQSDSDKKINQTIADLNRAQDKRIAELEMQNKQRERLSNQIHEDELEKVKRSHALMLSKKS